MPRTKIDLMKDRVRVVDWADVGDLWDDHGVIRHPEHAYLVELEFSTGELFYLRHEFGPWFEADDMVRTILSEGSVNLEKWGFRRCVYGSEAWQNGSKLF